MSWQVYIASAWWALPDDPRCPQGSGNEIGPGHLLVLDDADEAPAATAQGTISGVASLTGDQVTALAAAQGQRSRAYVVGQLGLT